MFHPDASDEKIKERLNVAIAAYRMNDALAPMTSILDADHTLEHYQNSLFALNTPSGSSGLSSGMDDLSGSGSSTPYGSASSALAFANSSNLIIGQGIANNQGVSLVSLSKIPSYAWTVKNDDEHGHHGHSNGSGLSLNSYGHGHGHAPHSSSASYHAPPPKGKNILNGISMNDSISSLSGNISVGASNLNNLLIRLPLITETTKGKERNVNGLMYYDKDVVEKQIRMINVVKPNMASVFTQAFDETIDDVEYIHGQVILNQFMNNKRLLRNYQWLNYYNDRMGGKNLKYRLTSKEFGKIIKVKSVRRAQLEQIKFAEKEQYYKTHPPATQEGESSDNGATTQKDTEEILEELEDDEEIKKAEEDSNMELSFEKIPRFGGGCPDLNRELIIEEEYPVDSPQLDKTCQALYGYAVAQQMYLQSKQTQGIIYSKIVKKRRVPNANSLGYSNIRKKKLSFTFQNNV